MTDADKYTSQKSILKDLDIQLPSGSSRKDEKYKRLVAKTLLRLPERVRNRAIEEVKFIITGKPLFAFMGTANLFLPRKEKSARRKIAMNIIFVNFNDIKDNGWNEKGMMQVVAHEIAHFELRHIHKQGRNHEKQAEEQTRVWGFGARRGIREKVKNYLQILFNSDI